VSTAVAEPQPPASTQSPATGPAPEPSSPPGGPEPDESSASGGAPAGWGGRVCLDPRVGR
jgi:hypothetical protein